EIHEKVGDSPAKRGWLTIGFNNQKGLPPYDEHTLYLTGKKRVPAQRTWHFCEDTGLPQAA
ncbi:hypothetical protein KKA14_10470, partial [bacterium]|nr:hypothetical protein [bacterium]